LTKSGVLSEKDVVIIQRSSGDDPFFASNTDVLFEIWKSEKDVTSFLDGYLN
jgi:hypothetical protein